MTDRPTPEQQLAEVIARVIPTLDLVRDPPDVLAAAIVAAGNSGDIDPIVLDNRQHCPTCTCGCTCGYGGQHEPDKATCELNRATTDG